jgi:PAS domain S-box-containing protein
MRITILVIDDDEDILFMAKKCLPKTDPEFCIIPATSAQEALRLIDSERIDAIICDFHLGYEKMNGLQLLEWIREEGLTTPFIIFTGRSREEVAIQALNLGADYYLEKSADLESLFTEISYHIKNVVRGRRTEEALIESEQRYRTLVNSIDDMIFVLDGNDCFSDYHSKMTEDLPLPPQEFLGRNISDVLPDIVYQQYLERAPAVRLGIKGEYFNYSLMIHGREIWFEAHMDLHEDGTSIVVIVRNITERIKYEKEIIEAERQWRDTFNSIPDFVSVHDVDYKIIKVNESLIRFLGMPKEKILGKNCYEVFHGTSAPPPNCPHARTILNERTTSDVVLDPKSGGPLLVTTSPIYDESACLSGVIHVAKDITDQVEIGKELEESEERFRAVFENASVGMTIVDADDNVLHVNEAFRNLLGYTPEEFRSMKVADFTLPEDAETDANLFQEMCDRKRNSYHMEKRYIRKDGTMVWGDLVVTCNRNESNEIDFISGMVTDITQQKTFAEQLEEDEIKFRLMFENAPIGCALVGIDSRILRSNSALADMLGYTTAELEGMNIKEFTHPEDWKVEKDLDSEITEGKRNSFTMEKRFYHKDGHVIWGWLSVSVARKKDGMPLLEIGMVEDITEEREITQKAIQAEKNLLSLFDSVNEYVLVVGLNGLIIDVNETVVRCLGYSKEELVGQPAVVVHPVERRNEAAEILHRMIEGKETICPVPLCAKEGSIIEVDSIVTKGLWNNEAVLFGVSRDVTRQRAIEKVLKENEQKYRALFERTHDAVCIISLEGNLLEINDQAARILGSNLRNTIGQPVWSNVLPDYRDAIMRRMNELLEVGSLPRFTLSIRKKDGSPMTLEISASLAVDLEGLPIHIQCIVREIHHNDRKKQDIETSEREVRTIVESMNDMIFVFDGQDRHSEFYASSSHLLFVPPEDFLGKHIAEVLPANVVQPYLELSERVRVSGLPEMYEYSLQINGNTYWFESVLSLHEDGVSIVSVVRNITERKRMEIEKEEQSRFLEKVIESLPHPFYVINAQDYTVRLANQVAREYAEPGASTCYQLTHHRNSPCGGDEHPCPLRQVEISKEPFVAEHQHIDRKGRKRDIDIHAYPILDKDGNVAEMIEYGIDMTDYRQALRALEESEERFRELFEKAPLGYQTLGSDGTIVNVNDAWLNTLGYTRDQVIDRNLGEFLSSSSQCELAGFLFECRKNGFMRDFEFEMIRQDGSSLVARFDCQNAYNERGEFKQIHCTFLDITEWKQAEAIIRMEHDRAQTYLDMAGVMIVALDLDGNVTLFNRHGMEISGYSEDELIGKNWFDTMIPVRDREEIKSLFNRILEEDSESFSHVENAIVTKEGFERIIYWHNSLLRNENDDVIGTLSSGEDITQRKIADDLLKRQRDELSELAHVMSHDIGNKLKSINSMVSMLKREYDEEVLDRISSVAFQSIQLLQKSAALADAGAIIQNKERVDLEAVARNIAATLLPESVTLVTGDLRAVSGSPERIGQIFQNLFSNAIEHANATEIEVMGKQEDWVYCIYVSNNGDPIPPEMRDRVFVKGFTTKPGGRGLGLSIVKKLVEAHGWNIQLVDTDRTTFRICTTRISGTKI